MTAVVCVALALAAGATSGFRSQESGLGNADPGARGGPALSVRGGHAVAPLEPIGKLSDWICIHSGIDASGRRVSWGEAAWNATGGTYWGGLQMDIGFMLAYGRDMVRRYGGWANRWTPRDQMVVAERARSSGRGYKPWPQTARACGLI